MRRKTAGFTLIEIIVTLTALSIIVTISFFIVPGAIEDARFGAASANLGKLAVATKEYADETGQYPSDATDTNKVDVDGKPIYIPPELATYIGEGNLRDYLEAPWKPHSWYNFDAWDIADADDNLGSDGLNETIQISIQFCDNGPIADPDTQCSFSPRFKNSPWEFDSRLYYCIKGHCRSQPTQPYTYPGYCINCPNNEAVKTKDGQ